MSGNECKTYTTCVLHAVLPLPAPYLRLREIRKSMTSSKNFGKSRVNRFRVGDRVCGSHCHAAIVAIVQTCHVRARVRPGPPGPFNLSYVTLRSYFGALRKKTNSVSQLHKGTSVGPCMNCGPPKIDSVVFHDPPPRAEAGDHCLLPSLSAFGIFA